MLNFIQNWNLCHKSGYKVSFYFFFFFQLKLSGVEIWSSAAKNIFSAVTAKKRCFSPSKRGFVSAHIDGSIISYSFDTKTQSKILTHQCSPYVLLFMTNGILASGSDKRIIWYSTNGALLQQFDCSSDDTEKDFYTAVSDPSGQHAIIGSFNR